MKKRNSPFSLCGKYTYDESANEAINTSSKRNNGIFKRILNLLKRFVKKVKTTYGKFKEWLSNHPIAKKIYDHIRLSLLQKAVSTVCEKMAIPVLII